MPFERQRLLGPIPLGSFQAFSYATDEASAAVVGQPGYFDVAAKYLPPTSLIVIVCRGDPVPRGLAGLVVHSSGGVCRINIAFDTQSMGMVI